MSSWLVTVCIELNFASYDDIQKQGTIESHRMKTIFSSYITVPEVVRTG